ncbi:expressed unknown protein [Seminavis robusta]|uniref:Uncharacterized protein n=1 Tax=Seminavis robusta TaxID=568900 RepID=A0A9N8DSV7_9STRA|nr:expressed unknown protein [Seminavis robusta]|eukprot:Sro318_g116050.1 n/a (249) ;mRNA; f:70143-70889
MQDRAALNRWSSVDAVVPCSCAGRGLQTENNANSHRARHPLWLPEDMRHFKGPAVGPSGSSFLDLGEEIGQPSAETSETQSSPAVGHSWLPGYMRHLKGSAVGPSDSSFLDMGNIRPVRQPSPELSSASLVANPVMETEPGNAAVADAFLLASAKFVEATEEAHSIVVEEAETGSGVTPTSQDETGISPPRGKLLRWSNREWKILHFFRWQPVTSTMFFPLRSFQPRPVGNRRERPRKQMPMPSQTPA